MTRTTQSRTRKASTSRHDRRPTSRDEFRIRPGRVLAAQARIASGFYDRTDVRDFLVEALLQELRRH